MVTNTRAIPSSRFLHVDDGNLPFPTGANNKTRGVIWEPHFIAKSEKTLTADDLLLSY